MSSAAPTLRVLFDQFIKQKRPSWEAFRAIPIFVPEDKEDKVIRYFEWMDVVTSASSRNPISQVSINREYFIELMDAYLFFYIPLSQNSRNTTSPKLLAFLTKFGKVCTYLSPFYHTLYCDEVYPVRVGKGDVITLDYVLSTKQKKFKIDPGWTPAEFVRKEAELWGEILSLNKCIFYRENFKNFCHRPMDIPHVAFTERLKAVLDYLHSLFREYKKGRRSPPSSPSS